MSKDTIDEEVVEDSTTDSKEVIEDTGNSEDTPADSKGISEGSEDTPADTEGYDDTSAEDTVTSEGSDNTSAEDSGTVEDTGDTSDDDEDAQETPETDASGTNDTEPGSTLGRENSDVSGGFFDVRRFMTPMLSKVLGGLLIILLVAFLSIQLLGLRDHSKTDPFAQPLNGVMGQEFQLGELLFAKPTPDTDEFYRGIVQTQTSLLPQDLFNLTLNDDAKTNKYWSYNYVTIPTQGNLNLILGFNYSLVGVLSPRSGFSEGQLDYFKGSDLFKVAPFEDRQVAYIPGAVQITKGEFDFGKEGVDVAIKPSEYAQYIDFWKDIFPDAGKIAKNCKVTASSYVLCPGQHKYTYVLDSKSRAIVAVTGDSVPHPKEDMLSYKTKDGKDIYATTALVKFYRESFDEKHPQ